MSRRRVLSAAAALAVALLLIFLFGPWGRTTSGGGDVHAEMASGSANGLPVDSPKDARRIPPIESADALPPVRGVVLDGATRKPIAGVVLVAHDGVPHEGASPYAETATDAKGAFELPCRPRAFAKMRAKGYSAPGARRLRCKDGNELFLQAGVSVEGRVVRAGSKAPIPGARVGCTMPENMQPYEELETDASGAFALSSCWPGPLTIFAAHPGSAPSWKDIGSVGKGEARRGVVIELADGRVVSGRVVDAAGVPVVGADVVALEDASWANAHDTQTGEDGAFEIGVGLGKLVVGALVRDGRVAKATFPADSEDVRGVELRLPAWNHVMSGRLVGDLTDVEVTASRNGRESYNEDSAPALREEYWVRFGRASYFRKAKVEGDRFNIAAVEPGHYNLYATSATGRGETSAAHDDPDIVLTLDPAASISLRITWEDGTPADGMVRLAYSDGGTMRGSKDGVIDLSNLPPGELKATYYPPEGPLPAPTTFVTTPGPNELTWTLSHPSERVAGRVTDSGTGEPIAGAQISVALDFHPKAWIHDDLRFVTSGPDGSFTMTVSSPNDLLFVFRQGYESALVAARDAGSIPLSAGVSESMILRKPAAEAKPRPEVPSTKARKPLSLR